MGIHFNIFIIKNIIKMLCLLMGFRKVKIYNVNKIIQL